MWPDHAADDVMRMLDRTHPIAHRFIGGIFQRLASLVNFDDFCPHEPHPKNIERLAANVLRAHIDIAGQSENRRRRRRSPRRAAPRRFQRSVVSFHPQRQQCWPMVLLIL